MMQLFTILSLCFGVGDAKRTSSIHLRQLGMRDWLLWLEICVEALARGVLRAEERKVRIRLHRSQPEARCEKRCMSMQAHCSEYVYDPRVKEVSTCLERLCSFKMPLKTAFTRLSQVGSVRKAAVCSMPSIYEYPSTLEHLGFSTRIRSTSSTSSRHESHQSLSSRVGSLSTRIITHIAR
jgi:hypothetical protein